MLSIALSDLDSFCTSSLFSFLTALHHALHSNFLKFVIPVKSFGAC